MESASLCVWTCVMAFSGTGVWMTVEPVPVDPPVAALDVAVREVPLTDVFALEEMLLEVLAFVNTLVLVVAVDGDDSAEGEFTFAADDVVVLVLPGASAEVEEAAEETPAVEEAVKSALPEDAVTPAPAPEDEPAVFDAVAEDELLVEEDWM
jgi:hypothetical protein